MKTILVTQRVDSIPEYDEKRDALDQNWCDFLLSCELFPLLLPNNPDFLQQILTDSQSIDGVLLTGGNDLAEYQGDAPIRDEIERQLISYAVKRNIPVLGVCRGMQVIQHYFGEVLSPVVGHVNTRHKLTALAGSHASLFAQYRTVNAFHLFGSKETQYEELSINAKTESGVVMAVEHVKAPVFGIMWHPEREKPYCSIDVELFKNVFYGKSGFHGENA